MREHTLQSQRWPLTLHVTLLLVVAGLTQAISLAWPFDGNFKGVPQGWLQYVSLLVLAGYLDRSQTPKEAFAKGWAFSFAWLLGATWWLFISMNRYGGLSAPVAALAVALLAAGLALFYGAACAIFYAVCKTRVNVLPRASAFAAVWGLAEMLRGTLWTGFPWGAVGYAHVDSVLQHWAPWVGVYGLCALSAFFAMAVAAQRRGNGVASPKALVGPCLFVIVLGFTWVTSPSRSATLADVSVSPLRVTLLQGNIAQDLKFGEGVSLALHDYRDALLTGRSDLIVTPETAIPLIPEQMPEHYWRQLQSHFSKGSQAALVGLPLAKRSQQGQLQYSNSALGLMPQTTPASTATYQYDKHHLVPFGEFVPPLFQWFVQMMNIPLGDFTRGDVAQPSLQFKGERIAPNICYEDLFGEELARSFTDAESAPTMLVNLSNIAWFGDTVAIDQHLHISRMRAIELGRPMLRATNTGATAIINAQGQVTHRLPSAVKGALTADVYGVHGPITPYARWVSVWGLWPLAGLALLTLCIVAAMAHASRHGQRRFGP
ncbi:apolipoprotein N-acyltransferase [Limnohabitans sp. INBF002]|nr:apolipoprotein N-acyltransferase [Limnohabitans sp. INBF002]